MTEVLDHWIAGATDAGDSDRTGPVYDPALGVVSKEVRYGSVNDVDKAVRVARVSEGSRRKSRSAMAPLRCLSPGASEPVWRGWADGPPRLVPATLRRSPGGVKSAIVVRLS